MQRWRHLGDDPVGDEGLDGGDVALWVVHGDEEVLDVCVHQLLFLILILILQPVLVDHGTGGVGRGRPVCFLLEQEKTTRSFLQSCDQLQADKL